MIEVDLKTVAPATVAFIEMQGPYDQVPQAMGQLYGWIAQHGFQPVGMPGAIYLTAPDEGPESEARWELQTEVADSPEPQAPDESGCGIRRNDAADVAYTMYKGPYEAIAETYYELGHWVEANGYAMAGPPQELYYSDPAEVPPEEYLTEIRFPVAKH